MSIFVRQDLGATGDQHGSGILTNQAIALVSHRETVFTLGRMSVIEMFRQSTAHRPAGKSLAAVVALQTELDNWVSKSSRRVDSRPNRRVLDTRTWP